MTHRPYKFIVQTVVQEVDDDGQVLGEATVGTGQDGQQPFVLYGCEQVHKFADDFPERLRKADESQA